MPKKDKITEVFGGGPSMSGGPSSVSDGPNSSEGHLKGYGNTPTIAALRDGSISPNGSAESYPASYGTSNADGTFVKRHVQRSVKGSGDKTGAGSVASDGSLGT